MPFPRVAPSQLTLLLRQKRVEEEAELGLSSSMSSSSGSDKNSLSIFLRVVEKGGC